MNIARKIRRRFLVLSVLLSLGTAVVAAPVWVVQATGSAPGVAERNYAASVCRRVSRLCAAMEIEHRIVEDGDVCAAIPADVAVLVLAYNPLPTKEQLTAIERFTQRGGKLIVFYSSSEALATLMGFTLGQYQSYKPGGRWSEMRFTPGLVPHVPVRIRQESWNIRSLRPASASAKVLALWHTAKGQQTSDPAWLISDKGLWMSHVLLDDQDVQEKERMLLAMVAQYVPAVWVKAADKQLRLAGSLREGMTIADSVSEIRVLAPPAQRAAVERNLVQAKDAFDELQRLYAGGQYGEVLDRSESVRRLLVEAYAATQSPRWPEVRGVWDHSGTGLVPGNWDRTCKVLSGYGLTDIFVNVMWPGVAHYASQRLSRSEEFNTYGDQLEQCQKAAMSHGLNVHVWKICWKLVKSPEAFVEAMGRQGRLQISDRGVRLDWLCPTHPANRQMELESIKEVARRYRPTGIHLDYIRYPDSHACYCKGCQKRFETVMGESYSHWPSPVKSGPLAVKYAAWRTGEITSFVRECRAEVRKVSPNIKLSAAVFGKYPSCVPSVGQDWGQWLSEGLVDFVCPMNYTNDMRTFRSYVDGQMALAGGEGGRIVPGLGVTAAESRLSAVETIDQVRICRVAKAGGFVIFDLSGEVERNVLPMLARGVTAARVNR